MSLVEVLVAFVLIAIVLLGGYGAVNYFQLASAQQRQQFEASLLATKYEELFQAYAYYDAGNVAPGAYNYTESVPAGKPQAITYHVAVSVSLITPSSGGNSATTVCLSKQTLETGNAWGVTTTVTWTNMQGSNPVVENTIIAPGQAGAQSISNSTIAVPLDNLDGSPYTGDVNWTLSAAPTGSGSATPPTLPNGGRTAYATDNGCAVVNNLPVEPGWGYEVTLGGNSGLVTDQEQSDQTTNAVAGPLQVYAGEVSKATPIVVAKGQDESVTVQPVTYSCGATVSPSCYAPSSGSGSFQALTDIPVSVGNGLLSNSYYTFGSGASPTPSSMLLFPYPTGYSVWAGDSVQASAGYSGYGGTQQPPTISVSAGGSGTVVVPVFNLAVNVSSYQSGSDITATEVAGSGTTYDLNSAGGSNFDGGLPLGQYELGTTGAALTSTTYVWVTPTGVCTSSSVMSTPCSSPSTSPVGVSQ